VVRGSRQRRPAIRAESIGRQVRPPTLRAGSGCGHPGRRQRGRVHRDECRRRREQRSLHRESGNRRGETDDRDHSHGESDRVIGGNAREKEGTEGRRHLSVRTEHVVFRLGPACDHDPIEGAGSPTVRVTSPAIRRTSFNRFPRQDNPSLYVVLCVWDGRPKGTLPLPKRLVRSRGVGRRIRRVFL